LINLILLNKPFRVLPQFTDDQGRDTLANHIENKGFYPAGRLDYDSEGLIALTNNGRLQHLIASPKGNKVKGYWVQVEGRPSEDDLNTLRTGVTLKDGRCRPAKVSVIEEPNDLWERSPPIRERKSIPTTWLKIEITEGKNRQVRRMTAAIGYPTLRLIRFRIDRWYLDGMRPGEHRALTVNMPKGRSKRDR